MLKIERLSVNKKYDKIFPYMEDTFTMAIYTKGNDIIIIDAWTEKVLKIHKNLEEKV